MRALLLGLLLPLAVHAQTSGQKVKKEAAEAVDASKQHLNEKKEDFEARMEARLATLKAKTKALKDSAQKDVDAGAKEKLAALEKQEQAAAERLAAVTRAKLPSEAASVFGVRLSALVSALMVQYRLSKRLTQRLLADVLRVDISLGMLPKMGAKALAAGAERHVREQLVTNADETGLVRRQGGWSQPSPGCGRSPPPPSSSSASPSAEGRRGEGRPGPGLHRRPLHRQVERVHTTGSTSAFARSEHHRCDRTKGA